MSHYRSISLRKSTGPAPEPRHGTPDIGMDVLRLDKSGVWVEDYISMVRICHGQKPGRPPCEDDELGVLWWGVGQMRHKPKEDTWKELS